MGAVTPARDRLTFFALATLYEALFQSAQGRVPPSPGLRLALAYLYSVGDRRRECFDREPYVDFWHEATQRDHAGSGTEAGVGAWARRSALWRNMQGIARAAGVEITADVMEAMRKARPTETNKK